MAHPVVRRVDEAENSRRAEALGPDPAETAPSRRVRRHVAEVLDQLVSWAAAGVQRAYLQMLDLADLDHIALLGAEVLPAVAG